MKQPNYISVFDSAMVEIATWDPIKGLQGLEGWSLNEQLIISETCIEAYENLEDPNESE